MAKQKKRSTGNNNSVNAPKREAELVLEGAGQAASAQASAKAPQDIPFIPLGLTEKRYDRASVETSSDMAAPTASAAAYAPRPSAPVSQPAINASKYSGASSSGSNRSGSYYSQSDKNSPSAKPQQSRSATQQIDRQSIFKEEKAKLERMVEQSRQAAAKREQQEREQAKAQSEQNINKQPQAQAAQKPQQKPEAKRSPAPRAEKPKAQAQVNKTSKPAAQKSSQNKLPSNEWSDYLPSMESLDEAMESAREISKAALDYSSESASALYDVLEDCMKHAEQWLEAVVSATEKLSDAKSPTDAIAINEKFIREQTDVALDQVSNQVKRFNRCYKDVENCQNKIAEACEYLLRASGKKNNN